MPFADVDIRMTNLHAKGILLYLAPEKYLHLNKQLQMLGSHISKNEGSELLLHLIRKELFDLIYLLSPLSKTRKIVSEILELTEKSPVVEKNKIIDLILLIEEIYPSFLSADSEHHQILVRTGSD